MTFEIIDFLLRYKWIILFYIILILIFIKNRRKVTSQAKIIFLLRTKIGLKLMDKLSTKYREFIKLLGYIGIGVGYAGLILISFLLIKNLYDLLTQPQAVGGVTLVLPGVNIPGVGVLPFWYWLIAIFTIALVHEFGHGVVSKAHKLEVKSSGMALIGPILAAFVEPDEKKIRKQSDITQYSIFAAGSFSNILLAIIALLLTIILLNPIQNTLVEPAGFSFGSLYNESYPAASSGLEPGMIITELNNEPLLKYEEFAKQMNYVKPDDIITIKANNNLYTIKTTHSPDDPEKSFIGIANIKNEIKIKENIKNPVTQFITKMIVILKEIFMWIYLLSLGIGLFNLLPLPIVDGGRMLQVSLWKISGKTKGEMIYRKVALFFLLVLLLNLFFPLLRKAFLFILG